MVGLYLLDWLAFCNQLSHTEGLEPVYTINGIEVGSYLKTLPADSPLFQSLQRGVGVVCNWFANGYRLPTNGEWEYAIKGGSILRFSFTSDEYNYDGVKRGRPIGEGKVNGYGLADTNNICEFVWHKHLAPEQPNTYWYTAQRSTFVDLNWDAYYTLSFRPLFASSSDPEYYEFCGLRPVRFL